MNGGERDEENAERSEPLSNGDLSEQPTDPGALHPSPATLPFDPWDIDAAMAASTSQQEADAEHEMENEKHGKETAPIANGKLTGEIVRPSTQCTSPGRFGESMPNGKPSTVHRPPSKTNADDKKIEGKKMKKKTKRLRLQPLAQ